MFTKKHFEKIAETLNEIQDAETKCKLATDYAETFQKDNPRFSLERFGKAINLNWNKERKYYVTQ